MLTLILELLLIERCGSEGIKMDRNILGKVLPLERPYTIQIYINEVCNFRCFYCIKSKSKEEQNQNKVFSRQMSFEKFKKIINNITEWGGKIKILLLQGWGEPLLHPDIVKMVAYAKEKMVADKIRIISNGSLLTHEITDALIDAGLDSLKISLQGSDEEAYKNISDVILDMDVFIERMTYFYQCSRGKAEFLIKAMDFMFEGNKGKKIKENFMPICDRFIVESMIPIVKTVDYKGKNIQLNKSFQNEEILCSDICTMPFMRLFINVDGKAMPCCALHYPMEYGDAVESIKEIWNGEKHRDFLLKLLNGERKQIEICKDCQQYVYGITKEEILDPYALGLIEKYRDLSRKVGR